MTLPPTNDNDNKGNGMNGTGPTINYNADGVPLDPWGIPFTVGCDVRVIALGYGATLPLTSGTCRVVALGPKRAEVAHPAYNSTYRVNYATLKVVAP